MSLRAFLSGFRGTEGVIYAVHNGTVQPLTRDEYLALSAEDAEARGVRFAWRPETAAVLAAMQARR